MPISIRPLNSAKSPPPDADAAFARVEYAGSVEEAAREADLVIEAVPEEMESKIEIFTLLDKICRPTTILASNTSSLSITEIASVTYRAKKCVGMHFFNPVHKMKLLEIVRAFETDDDTLAAVVEVGKRMGKEVVVIKESPGFITSRINAMIGNEAFYMLQEGIARRRDIDKALKLGLNHPMGPFELVDLVGLDTRLHILEYLHKSLGEKFRPAPLLVQYVKAGRLGRKSGRGVYEYPEVAVEKQGRRFCARPASTLAGVKTLTSCINARLFCGQNSNLKEIPFFLAQPLCFRSARESFHPFLQG